MSSLQTAAGFWISSGECPRRDVDPVSPATVAAGICVAGVVILQGNPSLAVPVLQALFKAQIEIQFSHAVRNG